MVSYSSIYTRNCGADAVGMPLGIHLPPIVAIAGSSTTYGVLCAVLATVMTYVQLKTARW
jgi:hypothetical protein